MKEKQMNLTTGNVMGQLVRYAIPLVLTSLLQALYNIVDMMVAGHYVGSSGISAINNAGQVMQLMTQIAIGITVGGNILIGRYYGSGEEEERKSASGTLFSVSMVAGILIAAVIYALARQILTALGAPALEEAVIYLRISAIGMIVIFGYNGLSAILRAVGNSKQPLLCIIIATLLNVVLDILFVAEFKMGVAGAAWATVISQTVAFLAALIFSISQKDFLGLTVKYLKVKKDKFIRIFQLGIPITLQHTIAAISWLVVTFLINQYGVDVSAGNGVSARIKDFCQLFIVSMSTAAATMIAQTIGAKMYDRAKAVMYSAMKITVAMATVMIILVELFAPYLIAIFTSDPAVIQAGVANLRIEIMGQWFYAIFLVYHSLAIGAGHTSFAMSSSFVNCIIVRLVLALVFNQFFGITGVYWALMIATSSSVPLGFWYTKSNVWRTGQKYWYRKVP